VMTNFRTGRLFFAGRGVCWSFGLGLSKICVGIIFVSE
jgi:hypothetical protein